MKQRQWKTTRQFVERPEAQRRWDQADQCLMSWTPSPVLSPKIEVAQTTQEKSDENSRGRPSLNPTPEPNANH
jgi:hypothetical protein